MSYTARIPVAREGYPFIGLSSLTALVTAQLGYDFFAFVLLALTVFIVFFFRDPERVIPEDENAVVSPADGRIIKVEREFDDRFTDGHVYRISIFMNVFDVHVNRAPCNATVDHVRHTPGRFYSANTARAASENEQCAMLMHTASGQRMAAVQIAGLIARRIVCWPTKGDQLTLGQRYGLIRFGSRVDLYLPQDTRLDITVGQRVRAGETILGYLENN